MPMNDILYPSSYVRADASNIPAWYEFLLKDGLLIEHLSKNDPEPSPCFLIKQFFDQANKPANDQGQLLPPPDNERNKSLKVLALQAAALLKWNLDTLERELPIASRHQLLTELMKTCKVSIPIAPQNELGSCIEKLHDHSIMALVLYCCWGARTVVKSTFPTKPGGRITPTVPQSVPYQANAQQRSDEVRDQILTILKDQLSDIVQYLEVVLHYVKRPIYLPNYDTFTSPDSVKTNDDPAGILVSFEELHAQLCYDLGCVHFTHSFYEKAGEMFGHVIEWLRRLPGEKTDFCCIDEARLSGYRTACLMINNKSDDENNLLMDNDSLYLKIKNCMKVKGTALRSLGEHIIDDIHRREVSTAYLDQIEYELEADRDNEFGSDTVFDVKWSNAVRRAIRNIKQPTGLWTFDMNVAQLQRIVGFVQLVSPHINNSESKYLGRFLFSLANNLTDETLREQLLNFEVVRRFIDQDDLNNLILRLKTPALRPLVLESESPASPDSGAPSGCSPKERVTELERDLITTFDPVVIKETLGSLYSLASGRKFSNLCKQWELDNFYVSVISSSTVDGMGFDLLSIVIAKARLCCCNGDYSNAKTLISFINNTFTAPEEVKVRRLGNNELLKVELLTLLSDVSLTYADKEECAELRVQLSDVVTRCRSILSTYGDQSKASSLPSKLTDLCTATLLNLEDLTFFMSVTRGLSSPPALRFACLLSSVRAGLIDRPAEARKPASELWSAAVAIFASMSAANAGASGRGGQKKGQLEPVRNLLPPNAIISRPALAEFVTLIKNPSMLQIVVSLLVHLHRLSRTDVLSDLACPGAGPIGELWPTGLDGTAVSAPCVTVALREVLSYCLTHQPRHQGWIRTMADLHYAFNNHGSALQAYLLLGALSTNYFNNISSTGPYEDEQVVQRMIKCCMQLRCHTQAAVLCQLTKDVDYPTAFKALQENRDRSDAAELHYFEHIWDIHILEHAAYEHRESNESLKLKAAVNAISRPELNHSNLPQVGDRVKAFRKAKFFQSMARQYLT